MLPIDIAEGSVGLNSPSLTLQGLPIMGQSHLAMTFNLPHSMDREHPGPIIDSKTILKVTAKMIESHSQS